MTTAHLEFPLSEHWRKALLLRFKPQYAEVRADHVTIALDKPDVMPSAERVDIVGYANSGDGIEAMVVQVDGAATRPDGRPYHITWSFDPEKYRARDSVTLVTDFAKAGKIEIFAKPIVMGPAQAIWIEETAEAQKSAPAAP